MDGLQTALANMKLSTRIGERKAAGERVEDLLSNDESVILKLNCNSVQLDKKQGDKMTWTVVFTEVRDYFVKETEKTTVTVPNRLFYIGLVRRVFEKATCNAPLLSWNKVYDFVLSGLQNERTANLFGSELMGMLQRFLEIDLYRSFLDAPAWIELITTLLKSHKRKHIRTPSLLRCLKLCIARGSLYDVTISCIRSNVVNFYLQLVQTDFNTVQHNLLSYLQGLIELCNQNAVEFRGILCKLGETIIPLILEISSFNEEEDCALVEFLLVQYSLHMPYDCDLNSHAFYAADIMKWKEILRLMYSHCIDIVEEKGRKSTPGDGKLSEQFLLLAAKCTKQISSPFMLECDNSDDEDGGGHPKKKMRYKSFSTIISDVYRKTISEGLAVWLNYLKTVLTTFPELVENKMNFSNLMFLGTSLFNNRFMIRREFYEYFSSLLDAEKYLRKRRIINDVTDTWSTVWDLTIKSISVCEGKIEAVSLLRKLLKEVHPTNITQLLMLYVNNYMPLLKCSVELLAEYLALTTLPVQISDSNLASQNVFVDEAIAVISCPRVALLRWLINISNSDMSGFEPLVAAVMCSLIVKQTDTLIKQEIELFPESQSVYNEFERKLLKYSFVKESELISFGDRNVKKTSHKLPVSSNFIVLQRQAERLADVMQMDYDKIPGLQSTNGGPRVRLNYERFISKVTLHLNVLNVIERHSIGESAASGQAGFRTVLERVFDCGMGKCNEVIMERLHADSVPARSPESVTNVIETTRKLFSNRNLCDKMQTSLSQKVGLQVLEVIKRVFRSHLATHIRAAVNNSQEGNLMFFHEDLASDVRMLSSGFEKPEELYLMTKRDLKYEKMSLTALQFLIDYGMHCHHKLEIFTEILKDLSSERACSAHLYVFDASALLIAEVAKILGSPGVQDLIVPSVELLQKLCRGYHMFTHCGEIIWNLLKALTSHLAAYEGISRQHFMILFGTSSKLLEGNSKVPKTVYKNAFDALSVLAKYDPGLTWSLFTTAKSKVWVLEELHKFLNNKCQEVRQLAADTICRMYEYALPYDYSKGIADSQEREDVSRDGFVEYQDRRKTFLDSVFEALVNSFDVEANLSGEETSEEAVNRTSVTLSCLTRLIFAFPYSQKQNIMFLFLIVKLKNIDIHLAKRALEYSSSNSTKTMCCYLSYVLKKILKLKHAVEDLPFQFFGCENLNAFLTKFRNEICVEYFEQNKMADLEAFAKRFNVQVKDLIKQCYGLIMARLTPGLASHAYPRLNHRGLNIGQCNEVHRRMIETLGGKDATDTLMATCVGDVILNLISLTFEPSVVTKWGPGCSDIKMPEPVPPHYPEATIKTCLEFLKAASPQKNLSLIGYLALTSHQSIYKIMLSLTVRIHEAHDELEKYWRMYQFSFFVNDLLMNEPSDIFSSMREYVCSFTFNAYLRLLKTGGCGRSDEDNIRFLEAVIFQIHQLVTTVTGEYVDEMFVFFNPVIRGLVSAVVRYPTLAANVQKILHFLLKTHGITFSGQIKSLDPFPSSIPEFEEFNQIRLELKYEPRKTEWPLSREFERFLEGDDISAGGSFSCTKERLQFLKDLLSQRKGDLNRMVKNIENKQFSDECEDDPLHSIIQMLCGIASSPTGDEEVAIEACKCLGEIGPVNLSVLVLPPQHRNQRKIALRQDAMNVIIGIISGYLSSEDIGLVTVAGKVLRSLFEFEDCARILTRNTVLEEQRLSKILLPFRSGEKLKTSVEKLDANLLESKLGLNEMDEGIDYKSWLTQLTVGIIECFRGNSSLVTIFLPLCHLRLDFCEEVFPYVVYLCLFGGRTNPIVKRILSGYFRNFFTKFVANLNSMTESSRSVTPSSSGTACAVIYMNRLALRCLIRVVQFLRRHSVPHENRGNIKPTPFDNNFWIDINYLDVARAAQYCGAYLTSILYTEIGATELDRNRPTSHYEDEADDDNSKDQFYSQGAAMYPKNRNDAFKVEKLLLKAYSNIGEADAAFGCGSARFGEGNVHHVEQTMNWTQLLVIGNGSSINSDSCSEHLVSQALNHLGVHNVLATYLKGVEAQNKVIPDELQQAQFECGWRLGQWNLNTDKPTYIKDFVEVPAHAAFQMSIYDSIQTSLIKDTTNHLTALRNGYRSVCNDLRHATLESSVNLYGFLSRLQLLRVVEDFSGRREDANHVKAFLSKWKLQDRIPVSDFKYQEPVMFLRNVLLRAYDNENVKVNFESEITDSLLSLIGKAREATYLDYADSCAAALASICSKPCLAREFEVAKIKWARDNQEGRDALFIMNQLIKKSNHEDEIYPSLLLRYGEWLSEKHCERPAVILEKYLQRACSLYEKRLGAPVQELAKGYIVLAKYADAQYQNVTKYINSDVFQSKVEHVKRALADKHHLENMDQQVKMAARIMQKHCSNDDAEIKCILQEQTKFLKLALRHYLKGLRTSNEHDLLIFRAISLWLEDGNDKDEELIEETTRIFGDETMPSYKYIVVLHQLSARLSNKQSPMNNLLKEILVKCAEDHPYHALPVLLTQASLHKDENLPKKNSSMKVQLAGRVQAAAEIVQSLLKTPRLAKLVSRMEALWLSLIKLANINDGRANADGIKKCIPTDIMKQLSHLETIAVPTSNIPVSVSSNYKDSAIGIVSFGKEYGLVGGINSPKKIMCRGTNGMSYNMLLKGQDDLRQDAVMQQVFGVMNKLLQVEPMTKTRRLHIRTYKVIPLSQRTGLIEWVENTQTLGEYLTGISTPELGAHVRYRPNDYKPLDCRRLLQEARQGGDNERRYATYMTICEHFKPVFRHFFFENFKEAGQFFEKRLAYTRSVATNSIVGYILGLGDRHVLNILIDKSTAELIHIDLGVAFEQGRILPTPETIPFRLTRDIIDGMGISGAEGVFRKSSEMTMSVLRKNSEIIITVLQVLLYDPLYMWTLSSDRVARVQPSDSAKTGRKSKSVVEPAEESANERNNAASRVLLRLRQKLMGIEEEGGQTGAMSSGSSINIDGHVSLLIQRAMDPEKLCKLFPGWQPYL